MVNEPASGFGVAGQPYRQHAMRYRYAYLRAGEKPSSRKVRVFWEWDKGQAKKG